MARKEGEVQVWIALAEVESLQRSNGFRPGERAFVNVFVAADSRKAAAQEMSDGLKEAGFHVVKLEELMSWVKRLQQRPISNSLQILAERVLASGNIEFGTFHSWDNQG